ILSRDAEAFAALQQAEMIFPENASLHLVKAQLLQAESRLGEAEQEYLRAVNEKPSDAGWFALATLYNSEKRYAEAERCVKESIGYTQVPHERQRSLGLVHLYMGRVQEALSDFDEAARKNPYDAGSEEGRSFAARLQASREKARQAMEGSGVKSQGTH